MDETEKRVRELLAAEYSTDSRSFSARLVMDTPELLGDHAVRALRAIRAALKPQWLPIEMAPTDGTRLMLWDSKSQRPVFGSWRLDSAKDHGPITHFAYEPAGPGAP